MIPSEHFSDPSAHAFNSPALGCNRAPWRTPTGLSDAKELLPRSTSNFPFASDSNRRGSYLVANTDRQLGEAPLIT